MTSYMYVIKRTAQMTKCFEPVTTETEDEVRSVKHVQALLLLITIRSNDVFLLWISLLLYLKVNRVLQITITRLLQYTVIFKPLEK